MFRKIFHTASFRRKLPAPFFEVLDQEHAALHGGPTTSFSWDIASDHLKGPPNALLAKIKMLLPVEEQANLPKSAPRDEVVKWLNHLIHLPDCLYHNRDFPKAGLTAETVAMTHLDLDSSEMTRLNRLLLEEAFPENLRKISDIHLEGIYRRIHAGEGSTALCFSGGGIRSATFALGITQGLAQRGLLKHFDYLSTVSGGGFIGSWLSTWIHHAGGVEAVSEHLKSGRTESVTEPEPRPLNHLRKYSNYLTPKLGLFSADTWVLVAIFLRNLLLNWLVFAPILLALFTLPRLDASLLNLSPPGWVIAAGFATGFVLLAWAMAYSAMNRPAVREDLRLHGGRWYLRRDQKSFLLWGLVPLCAAAVSITSAWSWLQSGVDLAAQTGLVKWLLETIAGEAGAGPKPFNYCALGAVLHLTAWLGAESFLQRWRDTRRSPLRWELLLAPTTGAVGGAFLWSVATMTVRNTSSPLVLSWYGCFAAPVFLMIFLIAATIFIGVGSNVTSDEDREWWARMGAWALITIFGWSLFSALVLFGPLGVLALPKLLGALGGLSGLFTLIVGHSAGTSPNKQENAEPDLTKRLLNKALSLAAPLSLAALVVGFSLATSWLFSRVLSLAANQYCLPQPDGDTTHPRLFHLAAFHPFANFNELVSEGPVSLTGGFLLACGLIGWGLSRFVNVNKFSLHAIYRNRLVRAYLGASNPRRNPNPFTGFDPADNLPFQELRDPADPTLPQRPLHIVNMALNLVTGDNLAWQQRKAETFTASTLHCGNFRLGYRFTKHYALNFAQPGHARTGLSLGTAVAISGAAASPNQGYHSSPIVALLMTLFNVRLGWWLGNPGAMGCDSFHDSAPRSPVRHFVKEGLGLTDSTSRYVYLSDGGHFENLALYEMVLRRARLIVVSDGGCDPDCSLEDLGNAIRKIRVDLGVKISFVKFEIFSRDDAAGKNAGHYCAIGEIDYTTVDPGGRKGTLIYLKPALLGNEPRDIYNYARANDQFPHEPTSDQWFSESQFESYRALGQRVIEWVYAEKPTAAPPATGRNDQMDDFIRQACAAADTPPAPHLDGLFATKSPT